MKDTTLDAKTLLREEVLPALRAHAPYFTSEIIRRAMTKKGCRMAPVTLNRYLAELVDSKVVFGSGRGWYSSLPTPFPLDTTPVKSTVELLTDKFPFLPFSCWSTQQVASYGHHLLAKYATFVHTDRDAMETVANTLQDAGWEAWINPTRQEARKSFHIREKTVVVRPSVSRAPVESGFALIEKILVDLKIEMEALSLIDAWEYQQLSKNMAGQFRISMGTVAAYARRRGIKLESMLGGVIN